MTGWHRITFSRRPCCRLLFEEPDHFLRFHLAAAMTSVVGRPWLLSFCVGRHAPAPTVRFVSPRTPSTAARCSGHRICILEFRYFSSPAEPFATALGWRPLFNLRSFLFRRYHFRYSPHFIIHFNFILRQCHRIYTGEHRYTALVRMRSAPFDHRCTAVAASLPTDTDSRDGGSPFLILTLCCIATHSHVPFAVP